VASKLSLFLAELKRRKVGRVAVMYAVVGVAVIEAADLILPRLTLPGWTVDFVVVLVVLGFPIALVLAWAVEVTPQGIQKTVALTTEELTSRAPERWSSSWIGFAAAAVVVVLAAGYLILLRGGGPAEGELVENRVFVTLFENQTGDPALEPAGRMAADFIIRDLVRTGVVNVLPIELAVILAEENGGGRGQGGSLQDEARAQGAAFMVSGSFFVQGDGLVVQGQILDMAQGRVRTVLGPITASRAEPGQGMTELAQRTSGALAALVDPTWSPAVSEFVPPVSFSAYAEMAAGASAFLHREFVEAIERYTRASELDSSFVAPLLMRTVALLNLGRQREADSVRLIAELFRDQASPLERAWMDLHRGWFEGDREVAYRAMERMTQLQPGGTWTFQWGYEAIRTNRLRKAVEILEGIDPSRPDLASWTSYWRSLTSAYHMLGEYQKELEIALRGQEQIPKSLTPVASEARALIALGRTEEAFTVLEEYRARGGSLGSVRSLALEFRAHGYPEAAREVLNQVLEWYDTQPSDPETQADLRAGRAQTLYYLERWDAAGPIFSELHAENPESTTYLGSLGCNAARLGDRAEALRFSQELEKLDRPYLWGSNTVWQARIAAVLGEKDRAVRLLSQAHREGASYSAGLLRDLDLESLRGFQAFEELMRPRG